MRNQFILSLALVLALAGGLLAPSRVTAQTTNTTALHDQLQALVYSVQAKAQAGKTNEADYSDELAKLDALAADKQNSTNAPQLVYMKAMLYLEVLKDLDKGGSVMGQIVTNYPGTKYSESAAKVVAEIPQMKAAELKQEAARKIQDQLVPGTPFPDFSETSIDGKPLSVASRKGKVVLVDFWATWCAPCRGELPNVIKTYQKHHNDGFEIIGVSLDSDRDKLDTFLKQEDGMTWPQYFDGQGWGNKLAAQYGVESIPFAILIGPDGKIIGKDLRGDDLEDAVSKALASK